MASTATTIDANLPAQAGNGSVPGGKFLTFFLAGEEYGIEILKVHEIIGLLPITRVPQTPEYMRGIINLRGKVIPIVDLRSKFGLSVGEATSMTCIIVVRVRGIAMGIVVDAVSEVVNINSHDIEATPSFGSDVNTDFILGIGKSEGRARILLDIDRALLPCDTTAIQTETGGGDAACAQAGD